MVLGRTPTILKRPREGLSEDTIEVIVMMVSPTVSLDLFSSTLYVEVVL